MPVRVTCLVISSLCAATAYAGAINVDLGTVDPFAVIAGSTVTNTGSSFIQGNLGVWPGTAVTGFPPGIVSGGTIHSSDAVALQAQSDLTTAYNFAAGQPCGSSLTGQNLGGLTLTPGVYCFSSSAQLTGTLTLDAQGNPNGTFVFQIGSTLTTASSSSVVFTNGGQGDSVFWQVGSSATLGTTTAFAGNILALSSITLNTGANILCGRALARNGAVTLDTNTISIDSPGCETTAAVVVAPPPVITPGGTVTPTPVVTPGGTVTPTPEVTPVGTTTPTPAISAVPEPGTAVLLSIGLLFSWFFYRRSATRATGSI